jgi:hypothetical protein
MPTARVNHPRIVVNVDELGLAHANINRDRETGVMTVDIGNVHARVRFSLEFPPRDGPAGPPLFGS